jgi:putative transposase
MFERDKTRPYLIRYMHCICISLSLRNTSKALEPLVDRSYVATIWYWINEEFDPKYLYPNKRKSRITAFIIDETQIQIGPNKAWLWVAVEEPIYHRILGIYISRHRGIC